MTNHFYLRFASFLLFISLVSCQSDYEKMESRELASGKQVNDLFFDLRLGMDRKEFFEVCWKKNKEGVLTNGPTELSVEHSLVLPSGHEAKMRFYPKFEGDKIYVMPIEFTYEGWAPWNEELTAEKLREDVVALFEKWYGEGFLEVSDKDKTKVAFVKIDGNRRIRVFKKHLSAVRVEIEDLPVLKKLKEDKNS